MSFKRFLAVLLLTLAQASAGVADQKQSLLMLRSASEHVSISDSAQTGLDLTANFTLEAWVKPTTQIQSGQEYVSISKWSSTIAKTRRIASSITTTAFRPPSGRICATNHDLAPPCSSFPGEHGTAEFFVNAKSTSSTGGYGNSANYGSVDLLSASARLTAFALSFKLKERK